MLKWLKTWWEQRALQRRLSQLVRKSRSPDAEARKEAALELAETQSSEAISALMELLKDTHQVVREAAQESLLMQGQAFPEPLIKGLDHPSAQVAEAVAMLLGQLQQPQAIRPLITTLKYAPRPVQMAARRALIQMGAIALEPLEAALTDSHPWVKQQAGEIVKAIRAQQQVEASD